MEEFKEYAAKSNNVRFVFDWYMYYVQFILLFIKNFVQNISN